MLCFPIYSHPNLLFRHTMSVTYSGNDNGEMYGLESVCHDFSKNFSCCIMLLVLLLLLDYLTLEGEYLVLPIESRTNVLKMHFVCPKLF